MPGAYVLTSGGLTPAVSGPAAPGGASDAASVAFTPAGTIAATDVQAAIEEVAAEAGGGSAWTQVLDADGSSLTGFTAGAGTWASSGGVITQTGASASAKRLMWDTPTPTDQIILEAEFRHDGTSVGASAWAGIAFAATGPTGTGHLAVFLQTSNPDSGTSVWSNLYIEASGIVAVSTTALSAFGVTPPTKTNWNKLRIVLTANTLNFYLNGVYVTTVTDIRNAAQGKLIGLENYNVGVSYRNIKAWTQTAALPA